MILKGTVKELEQLIPWHKLCELIHVDYYKKYLVSDSDEVFTVDTETLPKKLEPGLYVHGEGVTKTYFWVNSDQTCIPLQFVYENTFSATELDAVQLMRMEAVCSTEN